MIGQRAPTEGAENESPTSDRVMVMAKQNKKLNADLGLPTQFMVRSLTVFDAEASSNFVVDLIVPPQLRAQIRTHSIPDFSDANNNSLESVGEIALVVSLRQLLI